MKLIVLHDAVINAAAIDFIHPDGGEIQGVQQKSIITFRSGETLNPNHSPRKLKELIEK